MGQAMRLMLQPYESPILPEEIMFEIISRLSVKHVMRLRCVNKFFNTLIFDPHFIQMHLNKSTQNSQLALTCFESENPDDPEDSDNPEDLNSVHSLFTPKPIYHLSPFRSLLSIEQDPRYSPTCCWLMQWIGMLVCNPNYNFSFGYNNSTQTYKVVAFYVEVKPGCDPKSVVKVLSLGDNSWRDIQCLPVLPLYCLLDININRNDGVHLNGTINWFALRDGINIDSTVTFDQCVILSLELSTETYTELLLPRRFDKVMSRYLPKLVVLMDCLCFCHDFEKTHFVIWQMKDFGVQESWVQLFKISHEHFYTWMDLWPLYLSKNGDTLVLANGKHKEAFIYNCRDNKVDKIGIAKHIKWSQAKNYVESLVSTH